MSNKISPNPKFQIGAEFADYLLYTYINGTTTPQTTYNAIGGDANTNPIVLGTLGEADIWLTAGATYTFILKTPTGTPVWTVDGIVNDTVTALYSPDGTLTLNTADSIGGPNHFLISSSTSSNPVLVTVDSGGDANVDIRLLPLGTGIVDTQTPIFQCQFVYTSSSVCTLNPFGGRELFFRGHSNDPSGLIAVIPSAGVALSNSGLTVSTFYYVYAYISNTSSGINSTIALEASTTAPATDTKFYHKVKTGVSNRTLVGAVYVDSSGNFNDSATKRNVMSYYNRVTRTGTSNFTANRTSSSTTPAEINSETRITFIVWSDEAINCNISGSGSTSNAADGAGTQVGMNAAGVGPLATAGGTTVAGALNLGVTYLMPKGTLTEAQIQTATIWGAALIGGTATFLGGASNQCALQIQYRG